MGSSVLLSTAPTAGHNDQNGEERERERAEAIIKEMGLNDAVGTRIGGWNVKGISGGQKRRVSICIEILRRPKLLFLDEPTSGLDSAASYHVVRQIVKLAQNERISQAVKSLSFSTIFAFFLLDKLSILFFGSNGFVCPPRRNPSDHYLRTIDQDFDNLEDVEELTLADKRRCFDRPSLQTLEKSLDHRSHP
ncbi:hypothetical protein OROHE_002127 [Orobanche hederae]